MNEYTIQDIQIGMRAEFEKTITVEMEDAFRQISGDVNPLHYDDEYAKEVGGGRFSSHVTFGMLTASLYSTLAGVYLPGKYSLIHSLEDLKFLKPVYAGDKLTVSGDVVDKDGQLGLIIIKAEIRNQENKCVSKAKIKVLVVK
ncbi:MAG: MaoC family dehydratase [Lachnospiraceae bacterium]|nr:MaoC family dehydratase [Lachnospiraceae bacterium]